MITSKQFDVLNNRFVSHECRCLFIFEISSQADSLGRYVIDYNRIEQVLTVFSSDNSISFKPSPAQITNYLNELVNLNLINIADKNLQHKIITNFQNVCVIINRFENNNTGDLHFSDKPFSMHKDWFPSSQFNDLARAALLINPNFTNDDIASFRSYWMCRPSAQFSTLLWDQKFIKHLKRFHAIMQSKVPVYSGQIGLQRK